MSTKALTYDDLLTICGEYSQIVFSLRMEVESLRDKIKDLEKEVKDLKEADD